MISRISITSKLEKLKEYTSYLKEYQQRSLEGIKRDYTLQGALLHYLQLAAECVMDVSGLLISELGARKPEGPENCSRF